ncbi:hypothetical protein R1sor_020641 [Riccia sorocarpa]|uniref:Aldehyde dehydrogenase domain-containing protein n=1 Tax=Riccia sorocarpa TaxID=122646 RepID=A0ABD3GER5_9MARC
MYQLDMCIAFSEGAVSCLHMLHCFHLAGFPKGLISAVIGKGSEIRDFFTMHPMVNCIRLWEQMSNGQTHLLEMHSLSFLILDEADRMVEKGHFKELQAIIDSLPQKHKKSGFF